MKKIFIFILLLFLLIDVKALEIGAWTDEVIEDEGIVLKATEERYKWYQSTIEYSPDYYVEGDNDPLYPNIVLDDHVTTEFSEWSDMTIEYKPGRIVESKSANRYKELRPIRYLFLTNFIGGYTTYRIAEFKLFVDNNQIPLNITCNGCSQNFVSDVSDNLYVDKAYINNGGNIRIDLGNYYGIERIKIKLYMYDQTPNTKRFNLYFNEGPTIDDRNYAYKQIDSYVISKNPSNPEEYLIYADATYITNLVYTDWIYIDGFLNTTFYRQMQVVPMYRYKDIKYRYYGEGRAYLEGYYSDMVEEGYIKDDSTVKIYYWYEYNSIIDVVEEADTPEISYVNTDDNKQYSIDHKASLTEIVETDIKSNDLKEEESNEVNTDLLVVNDNKTNDANVIADIGTLNTRDINLKMVSLVVTLIVMLILIVIKIRQHILSYQK